MSQTYYGVGYGHKRGVYESWNEVKRFTKGFPQAVFKKFNTREAAQKYVEDCKPQSVSTDFDESGDKFYALPRGKMIGIFKDFTDVRKHISGFPKPLYKKFTSYDEAKVFYEKFSPTETQDYHPPKEDSKEDEEMGNSKDEELIKEKSKEEDTNANLETTIHNNIKPVARKRTGILGDTDDSEGEDAKNTNESSDVVKDMNDSCEIEKKYDNSTDGNSKNPESSLSTKDDANFILNKTEPIKDEEEQSVKKPRIEE